MTENPGDDLATIRAAAAQAAGLTDEQSGLLTATTPDDAARQAAKLAAAARPRLQPDASQGARPQPGVGQLSRSDLARMTPTAINQALVDGRLDSVLKGERL